MTLQELRNRRQALETAMASMTKELVQLPEAGCTSCDYFEKKNGNCSRWAQKPPQHVLTEGCDDWINLPF